MTSYTRILPLAFLAFAVACADSSIVEPDGPQFALTVTGNTVTYRGQGLIADGFGAFALQTELCGMENGAEADGPYILWIFTASKATSATITIGGNTVAMERMGSNGTFKYVSAWYEPSTLAGNVSATFVGSGVKNPQLVISHGCRPFNTQGAWCSPGFWHNAGTAAWALTGKSKSDLFNGTVYQEWYGATFGENPTLDTVLTTNGGTYKGAPNPGTNGHALNAFNAVGAFLTDQIPGYHFDWDVMVAGGSDACPLDHFGNFKQ